jgi:translation initiation factor IF-3
MGVAVSNEVGGGAHRNQGSTIRRTGTGGWLYPRTLPVFTAGLWRLVNGSCSRREGDSGIRPPDRHAAQHDRGPRINEQIRISPVRLIGVNGEQLGVVPTSQAMEMAREANLDLVEVAPNERPPVCKILDYGKLRYQQSRKGAKSKVHQQKLKEIRVRPKTGEHDVETKVNQARRFLEHNDKVLVNVLFRGRELQHIEEGQRIIEQILEKLVDIAKVEKAPSMEGRRMSAMLAPKSSKT